MLHYYHKVSSRMTYRFDSFKAQDQTNITQTKRDVKDYAQKLALGESLSDTMIKHSKAVGRPITVLDAGCGCCVALDELLSQKELNGHLKNAIGISKDYFTPVKKVMEKHGKRFLYYHGTCQNVLSHESIKVDMILDVWGAFHYTSDKMALLEQYYKVLKPGGKAYIYDRTAPLFKNDRTRLRDLFDELVRKMPDVISKEGENIVLTKSRARLNLPKYILDSYKEHPSIGDGAVHYTEDELVKGNAISPTEVHYGVAKNQPMTLRPKKY